jgi:hypothetical protein
MWSQILQQFGKQTEKFWGIKQQEVSNIKKHEMTKTVLLNNLMTNSKIFSN